MKTIAWLYKNELQRESGEASVLGFLRLYLIIYLINNCRSILKIVIYVSFSAVLRYKVKFRCCECGLY